VWLAGYFKGYFVGESVREVCAVSEDILLSEREQGREMAYKKVQVSTKISRNRVL